MSSLILASASPRRKQLLAELLADFRIYPADIDESRREAEVPYDYVARVATEKAQAIAQYHPKDVILASDTCVALGNEIFGKPRNAEHAQAILQQLSGGVHHVLTAIVLVKAGEVVRQVVETQVKFTTLSHAQIASYCATSEPLDKAGAYGIQGYASRFVQAIEGSYTGVIGLPLVETADMLREAGFVLIGDE